jgi:hypothetical protein
MGQNKINTHFNIFAVYLADQLNNEKHSFIFISNKN